MNWLLTIISIIFAALRICGVKSKSYQAFAHLFVGGLFGAAFVDLSLDIGRWTFDGYWWLWLAIGLSVVELIVFLVGFLKTWFKGLS